MWFLDWKRNDYLSGPRKLGMIEKWGFTVGASSLLFLVLLCRSALEKQFCSLRITWMMVRALNSRYPLMRRRYVVIK